MTRNNQNIGYEGPFYEFLAEDYYSSKGLKLDKKTDKVYKEDIVVGQHNGVKIHSDSIEVRFTPLASIDFIQVKVEI